MKAMIESVIDNLGKAITNNDWADYKESYDWLMRYFGINSNEYIKYVSRDCTSAETIKRGAIIKFPKGTKLMHCSDAKNLQFLKSSFCAWDGPFYSGMRIYFYTGERAFDNPSWQTRYYYECDGTEEFHIDMEFEEVNRYFKLTAAAVYMEKDYPFTLRVTQ